ncbi:carbohydrate kinase family protein [Desulfohalovibrio reitneri]|uniref:carbohydrate kinase family protein n=1 Tax=Desulfohalovibrio reitneri TaxID=1307759 RepID=UPI0004A6EF66|nr:carbohydrate kinase family protein [Desulfohalovibrio reitneri]
MNIFVSGSLALDRIMTFPGRFQDHILPEKLHILNICFLVEGLEERFGGTAGNIAYNLSLLGESPTILATAGKDFDDYAKRLRALGLTMKGIRHVADFTASAYITTDQSDNQITGFNPGAMKRPSEFDFDRVPPGDALAIVSPGNVTDMVEYPRKLRELKIPFLFDPGQQIPALSGEQLASAIEGSAALVSNDYELEMIMKATGLGVDGLLELTSAVVTTLGGEGCVVRENGGEKRVGAAKPDRVADPTGAGDAFRAGLIKGLAEGRGLPDACRLGAACASFCVELPGTQEHTFSMEEFQTRLDTVPA